MVPPAFGRIFFEPDPQGRVPAQIYEVEILIFLLRQAQINLFNTPRSLPYEASSNAGSVIKKSMCFLPCPTMSARSSARPRRGWLEYEFAPKNSLRKIYQSINIYIEYFV